MALAAAVETGEAGAEGETDKAGAEAEGVVRPFTPSLYHMGTEIESSGFHYDKRSHFLKK